MRADRLSVLRRLPDGPIWVYKNTLLTSVGQSYYSLSRIDTLAEVTALTVWLPIVTMTPQRHKESKHFNLVRQWLASGPPKAKAAEICIQTTFSCQSTYLSIFHAITLEI